MLSGIRVLAVDDEADVREVIAAILEECGATVEIVDSAQAALGALSHQVPDVLIADIGMPGEDGYSLIRKIRALPAAKGGAVGAVALTAHGTSEDAQRALDAGFTVHLPKPAYPAEIVSLVARLVGR